MFKRLLLYGQSLNSSSKLIQENEKTTTVISKGVIFKKTEKTIVKKVSGKVVIEEIKETKQQMKKPTSNQLMIEPKYDDSDDDKPKTLKRPKSEDKESGKPKKTKIAFCNCRGEFSTNIFHCLVKKCSS